MAKIYTSDPIEFDIGNLESRPSRIDLEFKDVSHGGASFEGRIFINNKRAGPRTPRTNKSYAGSFFVFGHGGCFGDEGHCDVAGAANLYDRRPEHALTPAFKRVDVTKAIYDAIKGKKKTDKSAKTFTVTVVPIVTSHNEKCDIENVLRFRKLTMIAYD